MEYPEIVTSHTRLRIANLRDVPKICDYYEKNREFLKPFEPVRPNNFYTERYWREKVRQQRQEFETRQGCRFFIFPVQNEDMIIGTINFNTFRMEPVYSCLLGYGLSEDNEGKGFMSEALESAIAYLFQQFRIHKIFAAYMPRNERSGRLLHKLGFQVCGYIRDHLRINGKWEDHIQTYLINPNWHLE